MTTERTRRLAAVFFADIVGYTDLFFGGWESRLPDRSNMERDATYLGSVRLCFCGIGRSPGAKGTGGD